MSDTRVCHLVRAYVRLRSRITASILGFTVPGAARP